MSDTHYTLIACIPSLTAFNRGTIKSSSGNENTYVQTMLQSKSFIISKCWYLFHRSTKTYWPVHNNLDVQMN